MNARTPFPIGAPESKKLVPVKRLPSGSPRHWSLVIGHWSFAALVLTISAPAQTLSPSKFSAHLINNYTIGSSNIVSAYPRTLKVLGLDSGFPSGMVQAMRDYKANAPTGKLVVRIYSPKNYSLTDDATLSAGDFFTNILQKGLGDLSASDRALIDYLEGPNEGQTPTLGYPGSAPLQASQWFNQFWTNLTRLIVAAGYKPCIGSIAVGNPGGTTAQMQSYLAAFVPALRQAQAAGGAWSYHAYTINYSTDLADETWYSLRYRQFYSYFASAFPDLSSITLILTEGGVDQSGTPATSGWQARGSAADFERWLNWFDQQMLQDSYVLGCTLFENGDPAGWSSFDLEPIGSWLKNYLTLPATTPPAPSGLLALGSNKRVTLTWTNAPLTPTSYTVKRSPNHGGPYSVIASDITVGVQATTYSDPDVTNSIPYFYVVSAINSFGESANSVEATATPSAPVPSAVNCGGPQIGSFLSDIYFDTGTAYSTGNSIDTNGVTGPAPMPVYQSQRYGNLTYTLPYLTPRTSYKVRLHFAEVYWTAPNQRIFNLLLNGVQVLTNFDIVAAAGASFRANIQEFNAISDASGVISVQLSKVIDNGSINGLELIANPTNAIPAAPTSLVAVVGNALVILSWSVPSGASGFSVKRGTSSGGPYSIIASNLTQAAYRDPSFVPNTTYYYVVSAANALGESPDSFEVSARPTNGLPDVVVTSVTWTPANLFNGSQAVFSARVLNRGSASTPAGTTLGVGFNVDGAGTASWSTSYSSALAPNSSVTLTADGGPNGVNYWSASTGPHFVTATVDDINRFPESIEDNNALTVPFTVFIASYAINSGGGAVDPFSADSNFSGGANTFSVTNAIDTSGAIGGAPAAVYQSERWGDFTYVLNNLVPGSNYTVRLHLAEISPSVNNPGDRQFNVSLNGIQVLFDLDVLASAGGKFRAMFRDIKKQADATGTLQVQFTHGSAGEPACNGLQAVGTTIPSQPPQFTSILVTNDAAIVAWQTSPSVIYQAQYKDDLANPNWTAIGNPMVAPGSTLRLTNTLNGAAQRFYRVVQMN